MTTSISSLPTNELVAKFPAKDGDHPWILASNRIEIDSMTAWHDDFFNGDQQIIERLQVSQCTDISWLVTIYIIFISNTRPRHNERYLLGPIFRNQCKSTTFHMLYKHILIISTVFLTLMRAVIGYPRHSLSPSDVARFRMLWIRRSPALVQRKTSQVLSYLKHQFKKWTWCRIWKFAKMWLNIKLWS